jgi:hypothetical protein
MNSVSPLFRRALTLLLVATLHCHAAKDSKLSDEVFPYMGDQEMPKRTPPLLEIGDDFLGTGNLFRGYTLPTGVVVQPRFWLYGNYRTALQSYDSDTADGVTEWVHRLDLFGNLQLTGTERILVGIQPLHHGGEFTRYDFENDNEWHDESTLRLRTLFFEGDLAELFPRLDFEDKYSTDLGFSVGRQEIVFQDGLMINDFIDAVGITRNSMRDGSVPWMANWRLTALWAWSEIHRGDNVEDTGSNLFGLFSAMDTRKSTIETDVIYVTSDDDAVGDLAVWGIGATQRILLVNTTFRILGSIATDDETTAARDGHLLFAEISWAPRGTHDLIYCNGFWGFDDFTSAARDPLAGGPLGRTGILFAAAGLGDYPAPLGNQAADAAGVAIGRQWQSDDERCQFILEAGARHDSALDDDAYAAAARYQIAIGRRTILRVDGFGGTSDLEDSFWGMRTELQVKF